MDVSTRDPRPFLGDRYRYDQMWLVPRILHDLVAIPANMPWWSVQDWGTFAALGATVGMLMLPTDPSPDARLQRWIDQNVGPWRLLTWTPLTEALVWGPISLGMVGAFAYGWWKPAPPLAEAVSLMIEAYVIAELYQFAFKLSIGREGPMNGDGLGLILGPTASIGMFPAGTPSGHAASFFALMGALVTYVEDPTLTLALHAVGLVFATTIVISDYHFISDVLWGAAMGYAIGDWVVRHRSTRWKHVDGVAVKKGQPSAAVRVLPLVDPARGVYGATLAGAF